MNISTSIKCQNVRSFNLSDRNNSRIDPKIEACIYEQDDIILLTNVQIGSNKKRIVQKFLRKGYEIFINSESNAAAGVAICLRIAKDIKVLSVKKDDNDRVIILKLMVEEEIIAVVSFYDSNTNSSEYMEWIDSALAEENISQGIIIGGDMNTITDPQLDQKGFIIRPHARTHASRHLLNWQTSNKFIDIYRKKNPGGRAITYVPDACNERHKPTKGRRLDQILVSTDLLIDEAEVLHKGDAFYRDHCNMTLASFDHGAVRLLINKTRAEIGPGQFKLDPFLLKSGLLDNVINQVILESHIYTCSIPEIVTVYEERNLVIAPLVDRLLALENLKEDGAPLTDEEKVLILRISEEDKKLHTIEQLEVINAPVADQVLTCIQNGILTRVKTEQGHLLKARKNELKDIINELHEANRNVTSLDPATVEEATNKKYEFESKYEEFFARKLANSKLFNEINQEKPTKWFFNFLSDHQSNESPSNKLRKDGQKYATNEEAREDLKTHFEGIFKSRENERSSTIEEFLGELSDSEAVLSRKLTEEEKIKMDERVTNEELKEVLNKTESGKTPGPDALDKVFLSRYWSQIGNTITTALNIFVEREELDSFLDSGIIKVIRKGGTSGEHFKNWRPITLLSQVYKLFSGVVALRLKPLLGKLISGCQKAYTNVSNIGEIVLDIIETIAIANHKKDPGMILLVDFSKAFDSISHSYIFETFNFLNFGDHFLSILHTMLNKRSCSLMVDGFLSSSFKIERGVPQGDTASPYIFIIVLEILILRLNHDPGIIKLTLRYADSDTQDSINADPLLVFADDMTIVMKETEDNLVRIRDIFKDFAKLSGLEINEDKTNIIRIGTRLDDLTPMTNKVSFKYTTKFKILGFDIDNELKELDNNFLKKEKKINRLIYMWSKLNLTTIGNLIISKTFLVSQLSYLLSVLECPEPILTRMQQNINKFILKAANPWIAKDRIYLPMSKGGLGAINLSSFSSSLKMSWARRAVSSSGIWAQILRSKVSSNLNICYVRKDDVKPYHKALQPILGAFEAVVDKHTRNIKRNKPLLTLTPLSLIECVSRPRPRGKEIFVKPTKASHPELFPGGRICEIRPLDLLDRLNLELGIVKIVSNEQIQNVLGIGDQDNIRRSMATMRTRRIMVSLKDYLMVERKQVTFPLPNIVEETKRGSRKYRDILDKNDGVRVKPWISLNERFRISDKPGNETYFQNMGGFSRCKYLRSELQMLHLNAINGRLRYNKTEAKYKRLDDGSRKSSDCTFCTLSGEQNPCVEDDRHLYYECAASREVLDHICDKFAIREPPLPEDVVIFNNNEDPWMRLKLNVILLSFRNYINRCKRFGVLPEKLYAEKTIKTTLKLIISGNPFDSDLIEGLVPLLACDAYGAEEISATIKDANSKDDIIYVLYNAQRRTGQIETPPLSYLANNLSTGTRTRNIQLWLKIPAHDPV